MTTFYWVNGAQVPEAPTLNEIKAGTPIEVDITGIISETDWGQEVRTLNWKYRWSTPIKFPTTPESVCFLAGLAR